MRSSPASAPSTPRAYVSAASRGLALSIARRLARAGHALALSSRSEANLEAARATILAETPGCSVLTIPGDLARVEDQERILDTLERERFAPDVFVCSAGQPPDARAAALSRSQWQHDLEMILGQAVFAAQRFAPAMAERGFGRLIFISSTYAKAPNREFLTSSLARASLFALSKALMDEYADRGVASFVACLGFVDTPLLRNMAMGRAFDAPEPAGEGWQPRYREWASTIPARRIASAEELAEVVAFLASPAAEYMNGSVISFGGGLDRSLL